MTRKILCNSIADVRLGVAYWLLYVACGIIPKNHPDSRAFYEGARRAVSGR